MTLGHLTPVTDQLLTRQDGPFTWLDITNLEAGELQAVAVQYNPPDALVRKFLNDQIHTQF